MMAPLPTSSHATDQPDQGRVRLDVRATSGRTVSYEVGGDDFLIGGSTGCDLRLPIPNLPAVLCQISRKSDGLKVRRVTSALPILLNGSPLAANTTTPVEGGDNLSIGDIQITVVTPNQPAHIVPRFVPLDPGGPAGRERPPDATDSAAAARSDENRNRDSESQEAARMEEWKRRDAELVQRARDLDRQTEELESDRVLWYQRRQEIEQEIERQRNAAGLAGIQKTDLDARDRELARVRDELSALRERMLKEYQERRDELARQQEEIRDGNARLTASRDSLDAELGRRWSVLVADFEEHRKRLEMEVAGRRELVEEEMRQRRAAFEAELAAKTARAETEALARYRDQFEELERLRASTHEALCAARAESEDLRRQADLEDTRRRATIAAQIGDYEPKLRELHESQQALVADRQELSRLRELLASDREVLERERATFEAHQAAETERLMSWENTLVDRAAELTRRVNDQGEERAALERDRAQFQDDLLRLERKSGSIEEQERALEERSREVEVRIEQLKRDALEWEGTVALATAEQERLRQEAERLNRQKAELDVQSALLAQRAGELESQQAVLVVQRAKLERTRLEAERETAQLALARTREDEALAELRLRIREAEELRAQLASVQEDAEQERRRLEERDLLLSGSLAEINEQRDALAAEAERLRLKEVELDARADEFAEQAGTLKGRMSQALDLQARLEADRQAIREREAALAQAEDARAVLQEQLRRRAEDLAARAAALDELARQVASDRAATEHAKTATEQERLTIDERLAESRRQTEDRAAELERMAAEHGEKSEALQRHLAKLKDVGAAVAAERKALAEARALWEAERTSMLEADRRSREELAAFRREAAADLAALREQAPQLEDESRAALERFSAARDMLRGHLNELHDYARISREDLDAIRAQVREEADRLRDQDELLNRGRAEHRLAVSAFRQQLIEWQGQIAEMKRTLTHSESRLEARQAAIDQAALQVDATTQHLAEQAEELRREREAVTARRTEMERHLAEMREWYRKKLRELAKTGGENRVALKLHDAARSPSTDELDPGDRQLGELLKSHSLVDPDTLSALWSEAARQRRTLRQVLLSSGTITLYQLALIEAGNLDALVLDRFRVIDRLRATPRETIYRVFDPARAGGRSPAEGAYLLRHLAEGEMQDAVHPDEFRQRFAAARDAAHPNLAAVAEVLEINGRPAVLQEWPAGLYSTDWSAHAAHPGCWVRLASMAAAGIDAAHRHGLVHGRLTLDSFVLAPDGVLRVTGFGEPPWLTVGPAMSFDPTPATDLRSFGQVAFAWSQLATRRKTASKVRAFPESLLAVIRRLEADPEPPMADTVAAGRPYESAAELVADLDRIARETGFSDEAWAKLLKHVVENAPEAPTGLRRSA